MTALAHSNKEVREVAVEILLELYKKVNHLRVGFHVYLFCSIYDPLLNLKHSGANLHRFSISKVGGPVRTYLPPDEPATRKNPLYGKIFDGFDKLDGKPTKAERKVLISFLAFMLTVIHNLIT